MPAVFLCDQDLRWLHRHLPKAIESIFGELELAIANETRDLEMQLTDDENSAKRVLAEVKATMCAFNVEDR